MGSNHRPHAYQACALPLSYTCNLGEFWCVMDDLNVRPLRYRRSALPTELIAHVSVEDRALDPGGKQHADLVEKMVGPERLELPASCMSSRHSTN